MAEEMGDKEVYRRAGNGGNRGQEERREGIKGENRRREAKAGRGAIEVMN